MSITIKCLRINYLIYFVYYMYLLRRKNLFNLFIFYNSENVIFDFLLTFNIKSTINKSYRDIYFI